MRKFVLCCGSGIVTSTHIRKKIEEEAPVVEEVREESAVAAQPIQEPDNVIVEPGTAKIRSKVLEEIENSYKKEPDAVPKKKYKVISIG